jgi:Zn-dependent protease with chaperone function
MYKAIATNKRNTVMIMMMFVVIIGAIGGLMAWLFNDIYVVGYALFFATIYALIQYFFASKLAVSMTGAKKIERNDCPRLYNAIENLSISTGLPMPEVYIIEDSAPNAFATGRDPEHSLVAATTGLIDVMNDEELTAVMAHEMSHIKNYDIRVSMITFGLVCVIGAMSDIAGRILIRGGDRDSKSGGVILIVVGLVIMILAPVFAAIVQMAVSRQREYLADSSSAMMTRYPEGMVSALQKLQEHGRPMKRQNSATEAMFINNPLKKGFLNKIFSTHPPLDDRIKKLSEMKEKF